MVLDEDNQVALLMFSNFAWQPLPLNSDPCLLIEIHCALTCNEMGTNIQYEYQYDMCDIIILIH